MTIIVPTAFTGAAIQTAFDTLQAATSNPDGTRPTIRLQQGSYLLDAPLNLTLTDRLSLEMFGAGATYATKLVPTVNFPANSPLINLVVTPGAFGPLTDFILRDFMIDCTYTVNGVDHIVPGAVGVRIISTTGRTGSFTANTVENVAIANAQYGVHIYNSGKINFEHCGIWSQKVDNAVGMLIEATPSGFTGDVNLNLCNIVCKPGGNSRGLVLKAVGPSDHTEAGDVGQVKGFGFNNSVINQADLNVEILAQAGGAVGDIWFNPRSQFDGQDASFNSGRGFDVTATGANSLVDNLNIEGLYFRGLYAAQPTIKTTTSGGGRIRTVSIVNNWVGNTSQPFVELTNVDGAVVSGNRIYAVGKNDGTNLDHYIGFYNSRGFACSGNVATQLDRATYWGVRIDSACNDFAVTGNVFYGAVNLGNVDNQTTAGVERVVGMNA
ncbi:MULTISPECIES: hypothetical protein [unclassified Caulobacter]|uniref:hypothetical protein n=1 Tax=unclassified Caulobacter TaxID=2648921 RepID=UPI0004A766BC|nr:hypothetical protein [Caulobacter sp. UNC358MFTsu5.1]